MYNLILVVTLLLIPLLTQHQNALFAQTQQPTHLPNEAEQTLATTRKELSFYKTLFWVTFSLMMIKTVGLGYSIVQLRRQRKFIQQQHAWLGDYLTKPFAEEELLARMQNYQGRVRTMQEQPEGVEVVPYKYWKETVGSEVHVGQNMDWLRQVEELVLAQVSN